MNIARATEDDKLGILELLLQVNNVHAEGRPDLFVMNARKYSEPELLELLKDEERPVFLAKSDSGEVLGYAFCVLEHISGNNMVSRTTLYIDDLCVLENHRGEHIGTQIYRYVLDYARSIHCYNVTLNVWECNPSARKFYDRMGLKPYKTGMEVIL